MDPAGCCCVVGVRSSGMVWCGVVGFVSLLACVRVGKQERDERMRTAPAAVEYDGGFACCLAVI